MPSRCRPALVVALVAEPRVATLRVEIGKLPPDGFDVVAGCHRELGLCQPSILGITSICLAGRAPGDDRPDELLSAIARAWHIHGEAPHPNAQPGIATKSSHDCHTRARRISEPLEAPRNWTRPNKIHCSCRHGAELGRFLVDPATEQWTLRAAQQTRTHVESEIHRSRRSRLRDDPTWLAAQPCLHQEGGELPPPSRATKAGSSRPLHVAG